jgi:hypothetical protein
MTNHEQTPQQHPPGRRAHLVVVDEQGGKVGSPAPSERQEVYIAALRRGRLPHGQVMRWAKAWELAPSTVSEELAVARAALDASREAPAAKILAHELTLQAAELADNVRRLAAQAIKAATEGGEGGCARRRDSRSGRRCSPPRPPSSSRPRRSYANCAG